MVIMLKHLHMTLAVLSVVFFTVRFFWTVKSSEMLNKKWVKISPHVIDTFLLLAGFTMMFMLSMTPMNQPWLMEKLLALVAYIFTGYFVLKLARNKFMQVFGYLGAIGWFMLMVRLATSKTPVFFT